LIGSKIGHSFDPALLRIYRLFFAGKNVKPNTLSLLGAFFGSVTCVLIALDYILLGGASLMVSGLFDVMDGAVARSTGQVTVFGGFLDSVLDRYSDLLVMGGIGMYFAVRGDLLNILVTLVATIGTAIIPYARARAEASQLRCSVGILERPERILVLVCGLFSGLLQYAVIVLAVLTHVTVLQRILQTRREARDKSG
jgi:phosphatidylglycerophosphate synthase